MKAAFRAALAIACLAGGAIPTVADTGHRLMAESPDHLELTAGFAAPSLTVAGSDGESWTDVQIPGTRVTPRSGELALPEYSLLVAVPVGTRPELSILSVSEVTVGVAAPPAVWQLDAEGTAMLRRPFGTEPDAPGAAELVSIEPVGVVRHLQLARVVIRPARYVRDEQALRWSSELRLRVDFRPTGSAAEVTGVEPDALDLELGSRVENPSAFSAALTASGGEDAAIASIPEPEPSTFNPVKILIRDTGLYQIRRADLDAAGVNVTGIDPATFVLTHRGVEVPLDVVDGGDMSFDAPNDVIRFYGQEIGGEETMENVYVLTGGVNTGMRMVERDATPVLTDPQPTQFENVEFQETDFLYWGSLFDTVPTPWYWEKVELTIAVQGDVFYDIPVTLTHVSTDPSVNGLLQVTLQSRREFPGASPSHHVRIYFNGNLVDDQTWTGLQRVTLSGVVPQTWVAEGANTVRVEAVDDLGLDIGQELIDTIQLRYYDTFVAEADYLEFALPGPGPLKPEIEGLTGPNVNLYDISDTQAPVKLTGGSTVLAGPTWTASFSDALTGSPSGASFAAVLEGAALAPFGFEQDLDPTALRDAAGSGADMLIVAHEDFFADIQPLVTHRQSQGLRVIAARVGDVYDEFNGGIREVQGIQNFVQWAFQNYAAPAPLYLLLVGDATLDPADYRGEDDNYVNTRFFRAPNFGIAPSDTWIAAVNGGDLVPDLAVGRISVRDTLELQDHVANVLDYENTPPTTAVNQGVLYVADDDDPGFEALLEDLITNYQPPAIPTRKVYLDDYGSVNAATADIETALNDGSVAGVYMGHGGRTLWAQESLWVNADVPALSPTGNLSFMLALNCVNGYFINLDAEPRSLGEEWTLSADRGAIANYAPGATGTQLNYDLLSDRVFQRVFQLKETRLGLASWNALVDAYLLDGLLLQYVQQMVFFGDPAAWLALDSDRDSLLDRDELASSTGPDDIDSDDDGLTDELEPAWDVDEDGDGRVNAADYDADDDGLPDGLESGITTPSADTDTTRGHFVADADPLSTTDHRALDSDGGGTPDGAEDRNANGMVDGGETDPNNSLDDPVCSVAVPAEIAGILLDKDGSDVVVTWNSQQVADPCVLYRVYVATDPGSPDDFAKFGYEGTMTGPTYRHPGALLDGATHFYLVSGQSSLAGEGPLGHYGQ